MATLLLPAALVDRVASHAERAYPEECCGVLVGRGSRVERVVEAENAAPRPRRRRRYAIAPEALLAVHKEARQERREVVGYYHSHPDRPARPSAFDLEHAWPGLSYLIVAVDGSRVVDIRSWRIGAARNEFDEEAWTR